MASVSFYTPPHLIAPAQVFEAALAHYFGATQSDLRVAHLLIDNAIELLVLAYLRERNPDFKAKQGHHKTYIGHICKDLDLPDKTKRTLMECHNQRNLFYHEIVAGAPTRNAVYGYIHEALEFAGTILGLDYEDFYTYTLRLQFLVTTFKLEAELRVRARRKRPRIDFERLQDLRYSDETARLLKITDTVYTDLEDQLETVLDCLSNLSSTDDSQRKIEDALEAVSALLATLQFT